MLSAAALTSYTYFFVDDWLFVAEARRIPFSLSYLRLSLFEHFSPISRLLDKLLIYSSTGSFALAHGLELIMYAAAIGAFALVVRSILGNRWSAFGLTILFGQSLFLMRLLNWWTATANVLPATVLGLITFAAYLRWQRGRSRIWLMVTLVCFIGSLLDYEIAMLVPVYIGVVRLLVLEEELHPRAWVAVLRDEWVIWLSFFVLDVGALVNYYANYYQSLPQASLGHVLQFLAIAVFSAFIPAMFEIKNPQLALGREPLVIAACLIVALVLTAYVIYTRPRAWRCVAAFFFLIVITMLPVGIVRAATWGVHVAKELYYQQSVQFMFLILLALALRMERRRALPRWLSGILTRLRGAPVVAGSLALAALTGYGALYVSSVDAMANASWEPHRSRAYVQTFQASVRKVVQRTGREPVLYNGNLPLDISGNGDVPYNRYDTFFPMVDARVSFNAVTNPIYVVGESGVLTPVSFASADTGVLVRATVLQHERPPMAAVVSPDGVCIPAGPPMALLRVPLRSRFRLTAGPFSQVAPAVRLFLRTPTPLSLRMLVQSPSTLLTNGGFPPIFERGTSGQYIPLDLNTDATAVGLELPSGACVSSLAIGSFSLASR